MQKRGLFVLMMAFFAFMSVGCCGRTKMNISVDIDDAYRKELGTRKIVVDIVGIGPSDHQRMESYSMTKYWEDKESIRSTLPIATLTLDPKVPGPTVLTADNPKWDIWLAGANDKNPPFIYVLAQLPGTWDASKDKKGGEDQRRQLLPTGTCNWPDSAGKPPTVKLVVNSDRITILTIPQAQ